MIKSTFEESHDQEWIKKNITAPVHELVILRQVIPWSEIITRVSVHGFFAYPDMLWFSVVTVHK